MVFLQGDTMPSLHHFFGIVIVSGSLALCFCFDLDKVFLQGATTPPLHQKFFGIVIILGKWILCFCFDLAKVFLQGATMPTLHPKPFFLNLSLLLEGDIMLLLRLSQGISSGCHHATPTPFFYLSLLLEGALCFCFGLAKVFLQVATMPPPHQFFYLSFRKGGIMLLLRLSQDISTGCHHATAIPPNFFLFVTR